jgi:group I intron endonuclease
MYEAFVYCWTDKKINKLYIGSHKGVVDDGYICSSKHMLREYNERSQDFSRKIIAQGQYCDIRNLEAVLLSSLNAAASEEFYNRHNGSSKFFTTAESIQKSATTKRLRGDYLPENNPMFGKKHSEEVKKAHSLRMSGSNNPNYNKEFSEETKRKMSDAKKEYWTKRKNV